MCVFRIMNFFTLVIIFWMFFLCKILIFLGNNCFMNSLINMEIWLLHYICFITDSCSLLCTPASICYLPHIYRIPSISDSYRLHNWAVFNFYSNQLTNRKCCIINLLAWWLWYFSGWYTSIYVAFCFLFQYIHSPLLW